MKHLKKYFSVAILIITLFTGCDVLNVEPSQSIPAEGAIQTQSDMQKALYGCYNGLQSDGHYGRNYLVIPDLAADNLDWKGTTQDYGAVNNNSISPDLALVEGIWASLYSTINSVNNALYYLPNVTNLTDDVYNNFEGELRFIRALCYFDLVRLFGGVPIRELPALEAGETLNVPRSSTTDVYTFVVDELEVAAGLISNTMHGRATEAASKALLARVFLYMEDYENAWLYANDVIENYTFTLEENYSDVFLVEYSSESIFEIDFNDQDGNRLAQYFAPTSLGGRYEFAPTEGIVNTFPASDDRKDASLSSTPAVIKYTDIQQGADNVIVLRLSEMFLIRAEAEANRTAPVLDNIISDIDAVRNRASLGGTSANTIEALKNEILLQRRLELAFEGHRWFDLIRAGEAINVLPNVTSTNQLLYPIPQSEILSNDAIDETDQNPGY